MSDKKNEIANSNSVLVQNLAQLVTLDGMQKYLLGTKKNGTPRAVYDVVKDYTQPKKKKKDKKKGKKHKDSNSTYSFYIESKKGKKKKKNKKKGKHWHI